jgi:hypothetical protein
LKQTTGGRDTRAAVHSATDPLLPQFFPELENPEPGVTFHTTGSLQRNPAGRPIPMREKKKERA